MDNKIIERETHDLMNVESFSQLPFIRPTPPIKEKPIRLFGIEFGGSGTTVEDSDSTETTTNINAFDTNTTTTTNNNNNTTTTSTENNIESSSSSRRFECHYCCRNFPTSQALGGHQNAHKRERQHAKRAHLQSPMAHSTTAFSLDHHHHHLYHPLINNNNYRFTSSSSPSYHHNAPTWNTTHSSNSSARFYGTHAASPSSSFSQQPINGSPLTTAFWRSIPNGTVQSNPSSFNHEQQRSFQNHQHQYHHHRPLIPLLASEERASSRVGIGVPSPAPSQSRYVYDSKRSDHLSLDLHL